MLWINTSQCYMLLINNQLANTHETKKNNRIKKSHTLAIDTLQQPIPTQQQIACHTLMEQSWINPHPKFQENRPQPDDFLKVTLRPICTLFIHNPNHQNYAVKTLSVCQQTKMENQDHSPYKKFGDIKKLLSRKNIIPKFPLQCKQMQINQTKNINMNKNGKININNSKSFVGKQVLCLTQYIISQPQCELFSNENSRKSERSKYLRVLNQMKNRTINTKEDGTRNNNKMHKSMIFPNRQGDEGQNHRLNTVTHNDRGSVQRIRLKRNVKLSKDMRSYSLRGSKNNFMADTYTNRLV